MPETSEQAQAIARHWGGKGSEAREVRPGVWRFTEDGLLPGEGGFVWDAYAPGTPFPYVEDDGRPSGSGVRKDWAVRCINDAPDAWFTVGADGIYKPYGRPEVALWASNPGEYMALPNPCPHVDRASIIRAKLARDGSLDGLLEHIAACPDAREAAEPGS